MITVDYRYDIHVDHETGRILATDWKHGEPVTMYEYSDEGWTKPQWDALMAKHGFKQVAEEKGHFGDTYYYAKGAL